MELESAQLITNTYFDNDKPSELLSSSGQHKICDAFGDTEVQPRVGDEYQVEIPSLMTRTEYLQLTSPTKPEFRNDSLHNFRIGLPIPIMWDTIFVEDNNHESLGFVSDSVNLVLKHNTESHKDRGKCLHAVPGLANNSWNENEDASYLLGLYIFEKDFFQLKKFIGNKKMLDILSHYYGNFYGSENHCKWSDCRKKRSRRYVYGQKIFSGLRQQELLRRLFPHISEECRDTLMQMSMSYGNGKMQLEEYLSSLKDAVGLNLLVKAVGIGKGKQDLTRVASGSIKLKRKFPSRTKVAIGKSLSDLSTAEIIHLLSGDFRLSKAQTHDLFWEAVWPRLLARGWASLLPEDHGHRARWENSLVFLIPGIRKFSRKDLVKDDHYFNSFSDVLRKVASDPALIELETKDDKGHGPCKENKTKDSEVDIQDSTNKCCHEYDLSSLTPGQNINAIKYMVVETSLAEEEALKLRELRTLPVDVMETGEENCRNTSVDTIDESDTVGTLSLDNQALTSLTAKTVARVCIFTKEKESYKNSSSRLSGPDATLENVESLVGQKLRQAAKRKEAWTENKCQLPLVSTKHRRLSACNHRGKSQKACILLFGARLKPAESDMGSDTSNLTEKTLSGVHSLNKECSSGSTCKSDTLPVIAAKQISNNSGFQPQPRLSIDLNLPLPEPENEEPSDKSKLHEGDGDFPR